MKWCGRNISELSNTQSSALSTQYSVLSTLSSVPRPPSSLPMDEQLRTEFNEWARAGKGESMERGHRPVGEQAIARMRVNPEARVLDVGCGSGWATRLLADYASNGRVTGIDISDEMVELARESSQSHANVDYEVA